MPARAARICSALGCFSLVTAERPCPAHPPRSRWAGRQERGGTTAQRGYGSPWRKVRAQVLAEERYCGICGRLGEPDDVVDHIIPKGQGGTDARHNLRRVHRRCHSAKTAREGQAAR
jgi:5-methylcytosine-specific restriction protein A